VAKNSGGQKNTKQNKGLREGVPKKNNQGLEKESRTEPETARGRPGAGGGLDGGMLSPTRKKRGSASFGKEGRKVRGDLQNCGQVTARGGGLKTRQRGGLQGEPTPP